MTRRRTQSVTAILATIAAGALLLTGCAAAGSSASVTGKRVSGGTIVYGHEQEPPCVTGGWIQEAYLSRQVLDSLVSQTAKGTIVPWLATGWTVSNDQKVWTFTLKKGVKFTDGTPFNAQAVVDNFTYWLAGGNGTVSAYLKDYYASSVARDDSTFQLTLTKPYSPLLSVLSQGYFGIQSPTALKRSAAVNCEDPIGTGPFIVGKWARGQSITFTRNPDYNSAPANAKHQGPAYVDTLVWKFLADPTTRYGSLTSGETNVIYDVPSVDWKAAKQSYSVQQYITPGRPVTLSLNTVHGPFTDVNVRRALAYSLDRKAIVKSAFNGSVPEEGNGSVSRSTPGYDASVANDYTYDPAKAKALLSAAGWKASGTSKVREKDGQKLQITIPYGLGSIITPEGSTALQNLQQQAQAVGFSVKLVPVQQSAFFSGKYSTPTAYDASPGYWTSPTAGILYINYKQNLPDSPNGNNTTFYNNPTLENLIIQANSTLDTTQQDALYAKAQQLISDQATAIGLYDQTTSLAVQAGLKDVWIEASQGEPVFSDAYFVK